MLKVRKNTSSNKIIIPFKENILFPYKSNLMYNNNNSQQPMISYEQLLSIVRNLPQGFIDNMVQRAKKLGISESYISQGLQLINRIKN